MGKAEDLSVTVKVNVQTLLNGKPAEPEYIKQSLHEIKTLKETLALYDVDPEMVRKAYAKAKLVPLADCHDSTGLRHTLVQYPFKLGFAVVSVAVRDRDKSLEERLDLAARESKYTFLTVPFDSPYGAVQMWRKWHCGETCIEAYAILKGAAEKFMNMPV